MIVIKKATQAQTIAAIKSGDFSTVDAINRKAVNTIKGYVIGFAAAAFPLLLLAHYLIIGY